jgi:hypothetical protein
MLAYEFAFSKTSLMKIGELGLQGSCSHASSLERKENGGTEGTVPVDESTTRLLLKWQKIRCRVTDCLLELVSGPTKCL